MALSETVPLEPSGDSVSERIVYGQHNLSSTLRNYPQLRHDLLNRVLGCFQRRGLDGLAGWFGREFHRLLGEGIDAAPSFRGRFIDQGSMFFLDCGRGSFAVTAGHVFQQFQKDRAERRVCGYQIGNIGFDLEERLIDWGR
jgi:hypothetical protein